jgi:hypothetical protein
METQERLLSEMSQLITAVHRLVATLEDTRQGSSDDTDMSPEAIMDNASELAPEANALVGAFGEMLPEADTIASARAQQEVLLGYEIDRCSGVLTVRNRFSQWITVQRGRWTVIDVAIDGNGYWYWRCGGSNERSRGAPNFRPRVKRLKVWHATGGRKITWWCYDLL